MSHGPHPWADEIEENVLADIEGTFAAADAVFDLQAAIDTTAARAQRKTDHEVKLPQKTAGGKQMTIRTDDPNELLGFELILGRPCQTKKLKNENDRLHEEYLDSIPDAAERNRNLK